MQLDFKAFEMIANELFSKHGDMIAKELSKNYANVRNIAYGDRVPCSLEDQFRKERYPIWLS